ncbi:MAG: hypothetical protein ACFB51_06180 [Anaerolineae bacterium]
MMQENSKVERTGDGWSYCIDLTPMPEYVLVRVEGAMDEAAGEQYRVDLTEAYRYMVTHGSSRAPIIADYREFETSSWSIPRFTRVHGSVYSADHRLIVIAYDHEGEPPLMVTMLLQYARSLFRNVSIVYSMEEALALV